MDKGGTIIFHPQFFISRSHRVAIDDNPTSVMEVASTEKGVMEPAYKGSGYSQTPFIEPLFLSCLFFLVSLLSGC